jgi:hypothetical protein
MILIDSHVTNALENGTGRTFFGDFVSRQRRGRMID